MYHISVELEINFVFDFQFFLLSHHEVRAQMSSSHNNIKYIYYKRIYHHSKTINVSQSPVEILFQNFGVPFLSVATKAHEIMISKGGVRLGRCSKINGFTQSGASMRVARYLLWDVRLRNDKCCRECAYHWLCVCIKTASGEWCVSNR